MGVMSVEEREKIDEMREYICKGLPRHHYSDEELEVIGTEDAEGILTEEDKKLISKIGKEANLAQYEFRGCGQTTLKALQDNLGLHGEDAFKAASALAGGGCGTGKGTCGALAGAIMAIGIEFGRQNYNELGSPRRGQGGPSRFKKAYELGEELVKSFSEVAYGEVVCNEIQKHCFGRAVTGAVADDPIIVKGKDSGIYWSMIAEEARVWTEVAARLAAKIILRERRKQSRI